MWGGARDTQGAWLHVLGGSCVHEKRSAALRRTVLCSSHHTQDPAWHRPHLRRAAALAGMGQYAEAYAALGRAAEVLTAQAAATATGAPAAPAGSTATLPASTGAAEVAEVAAARASVAALEGACRQSLSAGQRDAVRRKPSEQEPGAAAADGRGSKRRFAAALGSGNGTGGPDDDEEEACDVRPLQSSGSGSDSEPAGADSRAGGGTVRPGGAGAGGSSSSRSRLMEGPVADALRVLEDAGEAQARCGCGNVPAGQGLRRGSVPPKRGGRDRQKGVGVVGQTER